MSLLASMAWQRMQIALHHCACSTTCLNARQSSQLVVAAAKQLPDRILLLLIQLFWEGHGVRHEQAAVPVRILMQWHALLGQRLLRPRNCDPLGLQRDLVPVQVLDLHTRAASEPHRATRLLLLLLGEAKQGVKHTCGSACRLIQLKCLRRLFSGFTGGRVTALRSLAAGKPPKAKASQSAWCMSKTSCLEKHRGLRGPQPGKWNCSLLPSRSKHHSCLQQATLLGTADATDQVAASHTCLEKPTRASTSEMVALYRRSLPSRSKRACGRVMTTNFRSPASPSIMGSPSSNITICCDTQREVSHLTKQARKKSSHCQQWSACAGSQQLAETGIKDTQPLQAAFGASLNQQSKHRRLMCSSSALIPFVMCRGAQACGRSTPCTLALHLYMQCLQLIQRAGEHSHASGDPTSLWCVGSGS